MPIDVDLIGEQLLGLSWLYEPIPEPPGTTILAALHPEQRLVVLNERHVETFGRNEGLERFTKAHELGHWVLHARAAARRHAPDASPDDGAGSIYSWAAAALGSGVWRLAPAARQWQETHANWFAAALLMPPRPLREAAAAVDIESWRGRYELRERCGVSITALNARLRQLGYAAVRDDTP